MPAASRLIIPARSMSFWLTTSASAGGSFNVDRKNCEARMRSPGLLAKRAILPERRAAPRSRDGALPSSIHIRIQLRHHALPVRRATIWPMPSTLPDPRRFADPGSARREPLVAAAERSLHARAASEAERIDGEIGQAFADLLRRGSGGNLAATFASAPSAVIARHLARRLVDAWT